MASSFHKPVVIFRLDDIVFVENVEAGNIAYDQNIQNDLIEEFVVRSIPITLSVIPFWEEQEVPVNNSLNRRFGKGIQLGTIEIAQHGFRHFSSRNEQTEFRGTSRDIQYQWIKEGREILQRAFSSKITSFVPPWNNYDGQTIRALNELKFNCLSGDLGPVDQDNENQVSNNLMTYIPASCSFKEVYHAVQLVFSPQYQSKKFRAFIVVCFHPYDFILAARNPISKIELVNTLDELKKMPLEFATLSAASDRYPEKLSLSRQVRAARVENLGKVVKSIPGLGFLLPKDYRFGRWIPFGVYLSEEVYSSIERKAIVGISFLLLFIWVLFIEMLHLFCREIIGTKDTVIWILASSVFLLSLVSYPIFLPERRSVALTALLSSGLCLIYWVTRNIFV